MRKLRWGEAFVACVATLSMVVVAACGDGSSAPDLALLDLDGRPVHPFREAGIRATVFVFTATDCPISNRYAPVVTRLHEKFAGQGVTFWLVYPDPSEADDTIRMHVTEYGYQMGILRDPGHTLVKLTGARVTPEVAVFTWERGAARLVYRGRIDDRYVDFGRMRPEPTVHDLEAALESVLAGEPVATPEIPAVGCFIAELP